MTLCDGHSAKVAHSGLSWQAMQGPSLGNLFLQAAAANADRPAVQIKGTTQSYRELADAAGRMARALCTAERAAPTLGAVFGAKSFVMYQGVLATLISGAGYVPLNPRFPAVRNLHMLEASGCATLVADSGFSAQAEILLDGVSRSLLVVLSEAADLTAWQSRYTRHRFVGSEILSALDPLLDPPAVNEAAIAYLLFTSGSTGTPKGVMVHHRNVLHYMDAMRERYGLAPGDRFSQTFDATFDLSVHDMFLCWHGGGCLCVPTQNDMMAPGRFIRDSQLTVWFSVPSVAVLMKRLGMLKPNSFPNLRLSLFCGEPLPDSVAAAWQTAAPSSIVENLYGPTEATIACTLHRFDANSPVEQSCDGVVLIGRPLPGLTTALVDDAMQLVPCGEIGELCVSGPQVAAGYWNDAAKTDERFVAMPWHAGPDNRWYRTGDFASINDSGDLVYRGRGDDQVKIRGFRVELMEIEQVIKEAAKSEQVAVLPYPRNEFGPTGTTAFVARTTVASEALLEAAKARLAEYMVPQQIVLLDDMPLNANGKIDKNALKAMLESQDAHR